MPSTKNTYRIDVENGKSWSGARFEILDALRSYFNTSDYDIVFLCSYLLSKFGDTLTSLDDLKEADLDPEIINFAIEKFSREPKAFTNVMKLGSKYTSDDFAMALISPWQISSRQQATIETPQSIIKLANAILDIKEDDEVADFGSGYGQYLISTAYHHKALNYTGYEISVRSNIVAKMRSEFIHGDFNWVLGDVFHTVQHKYDKIFCNGPSGIRYPKDQLNDVITLLEQDNPYPRYTASPEWLFNMLINNKLKQEGRAVAIVPMTVLFGARDKIARKYFVENHLIESIIYLPSRIFTLPLVYSAMVVLSHNNEKIKLIDAKTFYTHERRQNTLSDGNIGDIMEIFSKDSIDGTDPYRKDVSEDTIRENDFLLEPSGYFKIHYKLKNEVPFKSVIKNITRGAQIKAVDLDSLASQTPTNMQYLMISNINKGIIDDQLINLKKIDPSDEKYCIKDNDLVFSRSDPFKIAVVHLKEGQQILASSNFYILEIDKEKVNPYFLAALFNSDIGESILNQSARPSGIRVISMKALNEMVIPLPSLNVQNRIAEKYLMAIDTVKIYKKRLTDATDKLYAVIDEESGELRA